jgi:ribonuclease HI
MSTLRVGFFDGGSRGNPGAGGSGSVFVEKAQDSGTETIVWVAATALSSSTMTNNVAEFVGLHRLLAHAAAKGWTRIHVVGDSAMILRLLATRTPPKAKKIKHWYAMTSRLADVCQVVSWNHHYRAHNKMADWLANVAMDEKRSTMISLTEEDQENRWIRGLQEHVESDMQRWKEATEMSDSVKSKVT